MGQRSSSALYDCLSLGKVPGQFPEREVFAFFWRNDRIVIPGVMVVLTFWYRYHEVIMTAWSVQC